MTGDRKPDVEVRVVPRHDIDVEFATRKAGSFHEWIMTEGVPKLDRIPQRMNELQRRTRSELGYRTAGDPTAAEAETWQSAVLAMQTAVAAFQVAAEPVDTVVECRLGVDTVPVRSAGPSFWTTGGEWLNALYLAMVCREKERTGFLASVPLEFLRASAEGGTAAPYLYPWIQALQSWWRGEESYHDRLFEAVEAVDPEEGGDRARLIVFPAMRVFEALTDQDGQAFNDALFEALEWHRDYWTSDDRQRRSPEGYVALPLLGLTCLARELGLPVEVESDYLPKHLAQADWYGEFPT